MKSPIHCIIGPSLARTPLWAWAIPALLALLLLPERAMAQGTPCDCAQRWTGGGHWNTDGTINDLPNAPMANGIIRCASAAETQSQVVPGTNCIWNATAVEAAGIQLPFGEVCFDPSEGPEGTLIELAPPQHGQPVIWFNFDVRAYASSFSFQINDNSGDVLGWALYESPFPPLVFLGMPHQAIP